MSGIQLRPELVAKIRDGTKTQTRRPVKPGEMTCRLAAGRDYAVQPGRGQKAVCRINVRETRREQLARITHTDARAEGFPDRTGFARHWMDAHDRMFRGRHHEIPDDDLWEHFEARHGHRPVWVITFDLVVFERHRNHGRDVPVWLTKRVGGGSDYTSDRHLALIEEGEPVPPDELDELLARTDAPRRWEEQRAADAARVAAMPLTERLERALASARAQGVDTHRQEMSILARVEALEKRILRKVA